jgi:hypothetical protein
MPFAMKATAPHPRKSKVVAGFLALFLGSYGIHRFYLGQWWGVFYLLFGLLGFAAPSLYVILVPLTITEALVFFSTGAARWDRKYGAGTEAAESGVKPDSPPIDKIVHKDGKSLSSPELPPHSPRLKEIKAQIGSLDGASELFGRKEIAELPNILWEDERVEKLVQGFYSGGNGILVATNKRLVFVDKGFLYGLKVEDFPYDKISSIQYETGLLLGKITIFASGNRAVIDNVDKQQARDFSDYVRASITKDRERGSTSTLAPAAAVTPDRNDMISQLERLAGLKERGILTDEEFAAEKQRLLTR